MHDPATSIDRRTRTRDFFLFFLASLLAFSVCGGLLSAEQALSNECKGFWDLGLRIARGGLPRSMLVAGHPQFADLGYPNFLSLVVKIWGESVRAAQWANGLLWAITSVLAAMVAEESALQAEQKRAFAARARKVTGYICALSPLFLSFSGMLYSEVLAAFGLMGGVAAFLKLKSKQGPVLVAWGWAMFGILSLVVLLSTKSIFFPFFCLILAFKAFKDARAAMLRLSTLALGAALLLSFPIQKLAQKGGRGQFNFYIQAAKSTQPWNTIGACAVYNLSESLGKALVPNFIGACHKNDPSPSMPRYSQNPYQLARDKVVSSSTLSYWDGVSLAVHSPLKHVANMFSSALSTLFIEGIYPALQYEWNQPQFVRVPLMLLTKYLWSLVLWASALNLIWFWGKSEKTRRALLFLASPLAFFFLVLCNFPVEQRYFFPWVPLLHALSGLGFARLLTQRRL